MLNALFLVAALTQEPQTPPVQTPPPALTDPAEVLRRSADELSKLNGLSGKFQLLMPGAKATVDCEFRMAKPNMWEVTKAPIEIKSDGISVWQYDSASKIFEKKAAKLGELTYLMGFEGFFTAPPDRKALTLESAKLFNEDVYSVVIEPTEGFKSTKLFVDKATLLPRGWSITHENGDQASVKVKETVKDPKIDPESFKWAPSAGWRLLEQVEFENRLLNVGEAIPPVMFARNDGTPFRLADYTPRSKMSVVIFWNSDCEACKFAVGDLPAWGSSYKEGDLQMLSVNVGDGPQEAERALREKGWRGSVALSSPSAPATQALRIMAYPTIYMIGKDGVIKGKMVGWDRTRGDAVMTTAGIKKG